jgi:hypothetical protein
VRVLVLLEEVGGAESEGPPALWAPRREPLAGKDGVVRPVLVYAGAATARVEVEGHYFRSQSHQVRRFPPGARSLAANLLLHGRGIARRKPDTETNHALRC